MSAGLSKSTAFATLPPPCSENLRPRIRALLAARSKHKLVVLDDDPTGTQTVYNVPVLARWDVLTLRGELAQPGPCFYILTNSRSLTPERAAERIRAIARNLREAVWRAKGYLEEPPEVRKLCAEAFTIVSRSDSTLRGHYPLETDVLSEELGPFDATILFPYFEAGGRYTIDDIHYVADNDLLVRAAETPFARDSAFGYRSSNLRAYIEEKTGGRIKAQEVASFLIGELRSRELESSDALCSRLLKLRNQATAIVNAAAPSDAEVFAFETMRAEESGGRYLFRTAAQFVCARLGLDPIPLFDGTASQFGTGGLTVVGSYVPRTTEQLADLQASEIPLSSIPVPIAALLASPAFRKVTIASVVDSMNDALEQGANVVLFTDRDLVKGKDASASLQIGSTVSTALVEIVQQLRVRPRYFIAKGGITSSDLATQALGMKRSIVCGQLLPGVPVWELGPETKFPGMNFVVFPGNVGGPSALVEAIRLLNQKTNS